MTDNQKHPHGFTTLGSWTAKKDGYTTYTLRVPAHIAQQIEHLKGALFACELTEDGVLFRLVHADASSPDSLPDWAKP